MTTSEFILPTCGICGDVRVVCTRNSMRRYLFGRAPSEVFPCPACATAVLDESGKHFGAVGKRYGNPMIATDEVYFQWKARNGNKNQGWQDGTLFPSEDRKRKQLQATYPMADERWVRIWVLGERNVEVTS